MYNLSVFGNIKKASGAYIEVVSQKGAKKHIKIPLRESKNDKILLGKIIKLPVNLEDIEIRIWVTEKDEIVVTGYKLMPVSSI